MSLERNLSNIANFLKCKNLSIYQIELERYKFSGKLLPHIWAGGSSIF